MSKLRRGADGKPEYRSIDQLLAEAAPDDVVQRLPGKGRPIDLRGYMHAEADAATARQDLHPRRCHVEELQHKLRACWPPSVAAHEVFSPADVPAWLTSAVAKPDDDGDWQELAAQLATSSAAHNRRRAIARRKVEESLTKVADLRTRLNEQPNAFARRSAPRHLCGGGAC